MTLLSNWEMLARLLLAAALGAMAAIIARWALFMCRRRSLSDQMKAIASPS